MGSSPTSGIMLFNASKNFCLDKNLRAYVIGVAIGDGNLSNPNGRATRLRITCDKKYPILFNHIINSLKLLFPRNKVSVLNRKGCFDVSIYSNNLEKILGWYAGKGPKYVQKVSIPEWIKEKDNYKIRCLKGLIETDGSIYFDRGYKMVIFTTVIPDLAKDVYEMIKSLNFNPRIYKIKPKKDKYNYNQQTRYNIRLSKNVNEFLKVVDINKR